MDPGYDSARSAEGEVDIRREFAADLRSLIASSGLSAQAIADRVARVEALALTKMGSRDGQSPAYLIKRRAERLKNRISAWQTGSNVPSTRRDLLAVLSVVKDEIVNGVGPGARTTLDANALDAALKRIMELRDKATLAPVGRAKTRVQRTENTITQAFSSTPDGTSAASQLLSQEPSNLGEIDNFIEDLNGLRDSGRLTRLISFAEDRLTEARVAGNDSWLTQAATALGQALRRYGQLESSELYLREAVDSAEACYATNPKLLYRALDQLALTLRRLGSLAEGEQLLGRAIVLCELANDGIALGSSLTNLALSYRDRADYEHARLCVENAIDVLTAAESPGAALAFAAQGMVLASLGDFENAFASFNKAVALNERSNDDYGLAVALGQRADAYIVIGDLSRAKGDAERCLKINQSRNIPEGIAVSLRLLGKLDASAKSPSAARRLLESYELFSSIRHEYWSIVSGSDLVLALTAQERPHLAATVWTQVCRRASITQVGLARSYMLQVAREAQPELPIPPALRGPFESRSE